MKGFETTTVLVFLGVLATAGALAGEDRINPAGSAWRIPVYCYDTDGRLGVFEVPFSLRDRTHTKIISRNSIWPDDDYWGEYHNGGADHILGFHTSDFSEPFVTFSDLTKGTCVPVSASELGVTPRNITLGQGEGIFITSFTVLTSTDRPAPIYHTGNLTPSPCDHPAVGLSCEYLPGSNLFGQPSAVGFRFNELCSGIQPFQWGEGISMTDGGMGLNVPVGPVRMRIEVSEGSGDDLICLGYDELYLDFNEQTMLSWDVGLKAYDPAVCPSYTLPGLDLVLSPLQSEAVMVAALTGTYSNFTNITPHMDRTGDESWDVADMIRWRQE